MKKEAEMRNFAVFGLTVALLAGCVATAPERKTMKLGTKEASQRMRDVAAGKFNSVISAYDIPHGRQRDDSDLITPSALRSVAAMVYCPPSNDTVGMGTYASDAYVDTSDMTVKIKVNRPNCSVDRTHVKVSLDASIAKEAQLRSARYDRQRAASERDPKGPYLMGCQDYQRRIQGGNNKPDPASATRSYPKLDAAYASRLYVSGWEDARAYGARGVDCSYLSHFNVR